MYFSSGLILNSGPIASLQLTPSFTDDGLPKPLVLVGTNGSGKTGALSTIADALAEIAAQYFINALPAHGAGHKYFRMLGGRSLRINQSFELSALKFVHGNTDFLIRAKSGSVPSDAIPRSFTQFDPLAGLAGGGSEKVFSGDTGKLHEIFAGGAYAFFPSSRYEIPHWANTQVLERNPEWDFTPSVSDRLENPIIVESSFQELKSWLLDVVSARTIDFHHVLAATDLDLLKRSYRGGHYINVSNSLGLDEIFSTILGRRVRIARLMGGSKDRRVCIAEGNEIVLNSIDHLSAGQSSLLSIFGTVARYGNVPRLPLDQLQGLVLVDEIDDHLHADLQHDALPKLMKLFPRIQFIVSSHAPLFLLGMQKAFGEDGFSIVDLPSGLTIGPERFSEFESSLSYFRATLSFENLLQARIGAAGPPLVLTEGQTDPTYLKAASELLGFADLTTGVEFDWVGAPDVRGAQGGGKSHLDDAVKFLVNNPQFQIRKVLFLYDPETRKSSFDSGNLHVRTLTQIPTAKRKNGIENLLPDHVFEPRFFQNTVMGKGDDKGPVPMLQKTQLAEYLCNAKRDPADFSAFRDALEVIRELLLPVQQEA
ncbi:AAA family ATPase [Bradyrhizobium manausense]|uniref:AAA family ATPase n=1 Tax=Bradyrhizobium TaxID=374 RepID=UPI001BA99F15|nr:MULTISPECIES: AAA family ATPase [Bradyrhizobium]MBR0828314.1 AAA family ATPase [Bradyrhizobium manausense]UVO25616.1 AAA family ATPase [Bradyrhizobium arachidis]